MLKKAAIASGIIFIVVGILGFIPAVTPHGHLLGLFHVNGVHNVVHLLSGAVALACGMAGGHASRLFFRTFGIIYGLVAVMGFFAGERPLLGIMANNQADVWLHTAIALVSLYLGFVVAEEPASLQKRPLRHA